MSTGVDAREGESGTRTRTLVRVTRVVALTLMVWVGAGGVWPSTASAQSRYSTSEARELVERGVELERRAGERGDEDLLEEAAELYAEAVEQDPTMVSAYARLGYALYALRRSDEAVSTLEKGIKKAGESVEIKHSLGINLYQIGREEEAARYLAEVVAERDDLPDAFFILGKYHLDRDLLDMAKGHFVRYAEMAPKDPQVHRALATIAVRQSDPDAALASLQRVLELVPDDIPAHLTLGHVLYSDARYDDAIAAYSEALNLDSKRQDIRYDLASVHYKRRRWSEALSLFDEIIQAAPDHFGAAYFRAECLARLNRLDEAQAAFEAVIAMRSNYDYGYLKLAELAVRRGANKDATRWLEKGVKEGSRHEDVMALAGVLYRRLGRADDAVRVHEELIARAPDNADYHMLLGFDRMAVGAYDAAITSFEAAAERDAVSRNAWVGLSGALLYRGAELAADAELDAAQEYFERAKELDLHPVDARVNLAVIALRHDDLKEARKLVAEAAEIAPESPEVVRLGARLALHKKRYGDVIDALEPIVESGAGMTGASWHNLAVAYGGKKAWEKARGAMEKAQELGIEAPRNRALIAFNLGLASADKDQWRNAEKHFDEANRFVDSLSRIERLRLQYGLAIAALKAGRYSSAVRRLEAFADDFSRLGKKEKKAVVSGGSLDLTLERAYALHRDGKNSDALDLIGAKKRKKASAEVKALEHAIREQVGLDAYEDGKLEKAAKHLERASSLKKTESGTLNLAVVRYKQGRVAAASKIFQNLAGEGVTAAIFNLAMYFDDVANDPEEAVRFYRLYLRQGGDRADEVRTLLENKQRVFGDDGGGDAN